MSRSVLLIDNYDSFAFNLVDEFARRDCEVVVHRNDLRVAEALKLLDRMKDPVVVLSPGPGRPAEAGCSIELARRAPSPLLGVCLGHQAIVEAFGGEVGHAPRVIHGKATSVRHDDTSIFAGLPSPLKVGRYHSLAAVRLSDELESIAVDEDGVCMALRHRSRPILGLQFHPESILTPHGSALLEAFLRFDAVQEAS